MLSLDDISFSLDTPNAVPLNHNESYVKGWFAGTDGQNKLWLVVDGKRVPAFMGFPRADVASAYGDAPQFRNSGFIACFKRPQTAAAISLIVTSETGEIVLSDGISVPEFDAGTELPPPPALPDQPLISILLAVPETHPYFVARCVESVVEQRYANWQLCIKCHASAREYLEKIAGEERRIQLDTAAESEFVLRIGYADELHPLALAELANALNADGHVDLVYSDEAEIDLYGNRLRTIAKPDFDPEALLSWNFVGNGAVARRAILPDATNGWDQLLRMQEATPLRARHIAKPLYYTRQTDLIAVSAEPLKDHIARTAKDVVIEPGLFAGSFRLKYANQPDWRIGVFVRSEDGAFQAAAIAPVIDGRNIQVYELLGGGADRLGTGARHGTARSLDEMPEDVFIFINRPLDTVNHFFFEELAAQAMRADCGLTAGNSWHNATGENSIERVVHSVDSIRDDFFAVKRSQLVALGGFSAVASTRMPDLVSKLIDFARAQRLLLLMTPYAVATFDLPIKEQNRKPMPDSIPSTPQSPLEAAENERKLAAAQLREMGSERNQLRREVALLEETITRLKTIESVDTKIQDLRKRNQELNHALEGERRAIAELQDSISWKLTRPLRSWKQLVSRKP